MAELTAPADRGSVGGFRYRRRGGALLVVGAVAVLVARALLAPGVTGVAVPAPWPEPPPVGSCVLLGDDLVERVPCDQPHSGEVVAAWAVGKQVQPAVEDRVGPMTVSFTRTLPSQPEGVVCEGWVNRYTGWTAFVADNYGSGLWTAPRPVVTATLVQAPPGEGTPDRHWSACVVQTQEPLYTGTVRSATFRTTALPAQISVCINAGETAAEFVGCDQPHSTELIAVIALTQEMMVDDTVEVDHTAAEILQMCVATAALRTSSADPTYQGQLEVVTESVWVQRAQPVHVTPPGWLVPDCLIRVNGPGMLIGSIVGNGDGPLSWQN